MLLVRMPHRFSDRVVIGVDEGNRGDEEMMMMMMMLRREMQKDDMAAEVCLEERAVNLLTRLFNTILESNRIAVE